METNENQLFESSTIHVTSGKSSGGQNRAKNGKSGKFQKSASAAPAGKFVKPDQDGDQKKSAAPPSATEKVDWKKFKQEKKDLKLKRKSSKAGFDQISEAKQIYERLKW